MPKATGNFMTLLRSIFSFVRDIAERVVEQNNRLIQKLESLIGEGLLF